MKHIQTLKNKKEFDFVYRHSKKYRSQICDICVLEGRSINRFYNRFKKTEHLHTIGLSVSKKIGNAVKRNLIKRRLRVICKESLGGFSLDSKPNREQIFIIIAKDTIIKTPFLSLKEHIYHQLLNANRDLA